jgi:hypothetical protein
MASSVIKEITSVKAFTRARQGLDAAGVNPALMSSFVDGVVKQINAMVSFSTADAGHVTDALVDSPYGDHTHFVVAAIEARLKSSLAACKGPDTPSGSTQFLKCWWTYCLQSDWDYIRDKKHSWNAKMTRMVERGMSLGVNHPDEQCLKWLLALLVVVCYDELPDYKLIYAKLSDLKQAFIAERKAYPLAHVAEYPQTPSELSADMFKYAYGDEQPVTVYLQGINGIAENHIPLRKNSKLLKGSKKAAAAIPQEEWDELKCNVIGSDRPCLRISSDGSRSMLTNGLTSIKTECALDIDANDAEEQALLLEYKAKILRARQNKVSALQTSCPSPDTHESAGIMGRIQRTRELGPGLRMVPRTQLKPEEPKAPVHGADAKDEALDSGGDEKPSFHVKKEIKHELTTCDDGDISQLDPFARAAIMAMQQRNGKKKDAEKKTRKDKILAQKDSDAISAPTVGLKRPAAAVKTSEQPLHTKTVKAECGMKRPAAAVKAEIVEVSKKGILAAMPKLNKDGSSPDPVFYKGGVIYTAVKGKSFGR